jgi:hypothetical protein
MGGKKIWLEKHTTYCFDKFTVDPPGEGQVPLKNKKCFTKNKIFIRTR